MKTTQIVLAERPEGMPTKDAFRFEENILPELKEGEVLLKPVYFSVDPYMRGRMRDQKSYVPPYELNEPISGGVVATVQESKSENLHQGDTVLGTLPWASLIIEKASKLQKIDVDLAPASYYLGILGMPGLTAYIGLLDIGKPQEGETVVVSGAAGAVGSVVGQIAKIKGCRVVGIAGSDDKIKYLKEHLGYDEGINYRSTKDIAHALKEACPGDVDVYFDNVGGDISDAVITRLNFHGRMVVCGQIALYNEGKLSTGLRFLPMVLTRSILIQGFIVRNYSDRFPEARKQLAAWIKDGKLKYEETVLEGFDKLPEAFLGLFSGKNTGKMLVKT